MSGSLGQPKSSSVATSALADSGCSQQARAETQELVRTVRDLIEHELTSYQRAVLVAIAIDEVSPGDPCDRARHPSRAIYKTPHDARRKLVVLLALN